MISNFWLNNIFFSSILFSPSFSENSFIKVIRNNRKFKYAKQCYRQYKFANIESKIIEVHPLDWEIAMQLETERFYSDTRRRLRNRTIWKQTDIKVRGD